MSFRIEEKLFIKKENLVQFQEFLSKKSVKKNSPSTNYPKSLF